MKKHILCFGDSNTHGYCAQPSDCADGGIRFNENERWTCLLQKALGEDYLVIEEGLSGRTCCFDDPIHEGLCGLDYITPCLKSHEDVDLLIIMLGTNDTKDRFACSPACIGIGMARLVKKAMDTPCWGNKKPNVLVIAPPHIGEGLKNHVFYETMGSGCIEKSKELAKYYKAQCELLGCHFLDAEGLTEFNDFDCMHLTKKGHRMLADAIFERISDYM